MLQEQIGNYENSDAIRRGCYQLDLSILIIIFIY